MKEEVVGQFSEMFEQEFEQIIELYDQMWTKP